MANIASQKEKDPIGQTMMGSLNRLRTCCDRLMAGVRAQTNLGEAECGFLGAFPGEAAISSGEWCRIVGLSPSRGSRVIEALVQKGIVRRLPDPADRRVSLVELTEPGRRVKGRLEACMAECESALIGRLTPGEIQAVERGLAHLLRAMDEGPPVEGKEID